MLKMKKNVRVLMSVLITVWSLAGLSEICYSIYFILGCPSNVKSQAHAVILFNFVFLFVFFIGLRRLLFHFAKCIEKKELDLFVAHTLFGSYEFHKKDVLLNKFGQIKIDLYSCKITINKRDYIDCTPTKDFWKFFL